MLATGATCYVGGRLVPQLIEAGHDVRCLTRDPSRLALDPWRDQVEVAKADVLDRDSLQEALAGCESAYYLVHSMGSAAEFNEADRRGAANFRDAADANGFNRIVFLGGLGSPAENLSAHLAGRQEVGEVLRSGTTPVTEMRPRSSSGPARCPLR